MKKGEIGLKVLTNKKARPAYTEQALYGLGYSGRKTINPKL